MYAEQGRFGALGSRGSERLRLVPELVVSWVVSSSEMLIIIWYHVQKWNLLIL